MSPRKPISSLMLLVMLLPLLLFSSLGPAAPSFAPVAQAALPRPAHVLPPAGGTWTIHLNEVVFSPASGPEWVELRNSGSVPVSIRGYGLTDEDDNWYRIPNALPAVPAGARVVILFDGLGSDSDEYDFGDSRATLHSLPGVVNILEDTDQVALYSGSGSAPYRLYLPFNLHNSLPWNPPVPSPYPALPTSPLVDFVAWGAVPAEDGTEASAAGLWDASWYVNPYRGLGESSPEVALALGESIGLIPGSATHLPADWFLYRVPEVTQGGENALPTIGWYYPDAGAVLASTTFSVGWAPVPGAFGYRYQMDDNPDFSSPVLDTTLSEPGYIAASTITEGTYYWRVKTMFVSGESAWTVGVQIRSLSLPTPFGNNLRAEQAVAAVIGVPWQLQHKDTDMLCLDGDAETGGNAWNAAHTSRGTHGANYCARASAAMMAAYYGGNLSQDRITYETFKGGDPEGDLGHDVALTRAQARAALSWALGQEVASVEGKPTFAQIKTWVDANQPMRAIVPGHSRVLDGYLEFTILGTTWQFLHILDPWDQAKWVSYDSDNILYVQVGPAGATSAPNVRSDEDVDGNGVRDTMQDSDNDGIVDFDERNRFSLLHTDNDYDDDRVPDGADIREYIFNEAGAYTRRDPDVDADLLRKERDPDNDQFLDDGNDDGCEDKNRDGKFQAPQGETNNFAPADDMTLHVRLTWPQVGSDVDLHVIKPGAAMWSSGDVHWLNTNPDWGEPGVPCDDPRLDIDCIASCTVENVRLASLENGTYTIVLHYYYDHELGPTSPRVTVWVAGVPTTYGPRSMSDDEVWTVGTVQWPTGTFTPIDSIEQVSESGVGPAK